MNGILLACIVENISSRKDGTIKVTLGTNEVTQGKAGEIFGLQNKLVACYISAKDTIPQKELDQVDAVNPEYEGKTQSQRIRAVLYKIFEQQPEGYKDFEGFYRFKTEQIITHLKSKIN